MPSFAGFAAERIAKEQRLAEAAEAAAPPQQAQHGSPERRVTRSRSKAAAPPSPLAGLDTPPPGEACAPSTGGAAHAGGAAAACEGGLGLASTTNRAAQRELYPEPGAEAGCFSDADRGRRGLKLIVRVGPWALPGTLPGLSILAGMGCSGAGVVGAPCQGLDGGLPSLPGMGSPSSSLSLGSLPSLPEPLGSLRTSELLRSAAGGFDEQSDAESRPLPL